MRGLHDAIGSEFLALATFVTLLTSCQPSDMRPGLWLSGEAEARPVEDWSFSHAEEEVLVETRTWYGIPHSVTTWGAELGGAFYLPSLYFGEEEYPDGRYWNSNVARDPRIRVKIGDRLFEGSATLVTDESELESAMRAFAQKYPTFEEMLQKPGARWVILRFEPASAG